MPAVLKTGLVALQDIMSLVQGMPFQDGTGETRSPLGHNWVWKGLGANEEGRATCPCSPFLRLGVRRGSMVETCE